MATIILTDNFFIDVDPLNYTLKEKFEGKTKDGIEKESFRTLGYYGNLRGAIRKYIEMHVQTEISDETLTIEKYAERVENAVFRAVRSVEDTLRRAGVCND